MKYFLIFMLGVLILTNVIIVLRYIHKGERIKIFKNKSIFFPLAFWIVDKINFKNKKNNWFLISLKKIYICDNDEESINNFLLKKISQFTLIVFLILIIFTMINIFEDNNNICNLFEIKRPQYGEQEKKVELVAEIDGEEQEIIVDIKPNILSKKEINKLFEKVKKYIDGQIVGKNISLTKVSNDVCLVTEYPLDNNIEIVWNINEDSFIDYDGTILYDRIYGLYEENNFNEDTYISTTLSCRIIYYDYSKEYEIVIGTNIKNLSKNSFVSDYVVRNISEQNESYSGDGTINLPKSFAESELSYKVIHDKYNFNIATVLVVIIVLFFLLLICTKIGIEKKLKERDKQLKRDFPCVVNKLALLLGAGMTVKKSFNKMCDDYTKKRKKGYRKRYVYEEIVYTMNAINNGENEISAYNYFVKRIGLNSYMKLGSLLVQCLQRGNEHIVDDLHIEAWKETREHTEIVKQYGEKIDTKLVLPLIALLTITLIIVILPLFFSF